MHLCSPSFLLFPAQFPADLTGFLHFLLILNILDVSHRIDNFSTFLTVFSQFPLRRAQGRKVTELIKSIKTDRNDRNEQELTLIRSPKGDLPAGFSGNRQNCSFLLESTTFEDHFPHRPTVKRVESDCGEQHSRKNWE